MSAGTVPSVQVGTVQCQQVLSISASRHCSVSAGTVPSVQAGTVQCQQYCSVSESRIST